jgi:hypothetical protein
MIKKTNPVRAAKKFPKSGRYDIIIVMGEKNKSIPTLYLNKKIHFNLFNKMKIYYN